MTITAKVICDSINPDGIRLTTMHLRYPRMIHADFMTHRVFSRNGRSSRAVPFVILVKEEPYVPAFAKNQPGMVAGEPLEGAELGVATSAWLRAVEACKQAASELNDLKVHKQWVNRMLEWFGYIDVLVTSTDWANFFELRDEGGAQPEIQKLAKAMKVAMDGSTPTCLAPGEWHLPYIGADDYANLYDYKLDGVYYKDKIPVENPIEILKKISVARCARLTIKPFDGDGSIEKELKRYELLMVSRPVHASPAEHIATPDSKEWRTRGYGNQDEYKWLNKDEWGNFYGWRQFRKMIDHNTIYDR